jgi:hypothetical protein
VENDERINALDPIPSITERSTGAEEMSSESCIIMVFSVGVVGVAILVWRYLYSGSITSEIGIDHNEFWKSTSVTSLDNIGNTRDVSTRSSISQFFPVSGDIQGIKDFDEDWNGK